MIICYNQFRSAGVAHLVERHLAKVEVASSSLVTRSRKETTFVFQTKVVSFQRNKSHSGFVKCPSGVKYCFAMWNACGREWIYFISLSAFSRKFHNSRSELFHICRKANISLKPKFSSVCILSRSIMRRMPYIILRKQYIIKELPAPPEGFLGWRCLVC